jgi:hypothetical protein
MILLRQLLCCAWEDVLFLVTNSRTTRSNTTTELDNKIKHWNNFDSSIYDHVNQTFWEKIKNYENFEEDKLFLENLVGRHENNESVCGFCKLICIRSTQRKTFFKKCPFNFLRLNCYHSRRHSRFIVSI